VWVPVSAVKGCGVIETYRMGILEEAILSPGLVACRPACKPARDLTAIEGSDIAVRTNGELDIGAFHPAAGLFLGPAWIEFVADGCLRSGIRREMRVRLSERKANLVRKQHAMIRSVPSWGFASSYIRGVERKGFVFAGFVFGGFVFAGFVFAVSRRRLASAEACRAFAVGCAWQQNAMGTYGFQAATSSAASLRSTTAMRSLRCCGLSGARDGRRYFGGLQNPG